MENNIKELEIKNFKSIKHIKFNPRRVNVFIGKPNVGKSNILEGMSLHTGLLLTHFNTKANDTLEPIFRCEDMFNFFYDENTENHVEVITDKASAFLLTNGSELNYFAVDNNWMDLFQKKGLNFNIRNFRNFLNDVRQNTPSIWDIDDKNNPIKKQESRIRPVDASYAKNLSSGSHRDFDIIPYKNPVRRYSYKHFDSYNETFRGFLNPPFGDNLFTILNYNKELLNEFGGFIEEQGLEFVLDKKENKFIIQKKIDRIVYQVPYSNIADTLRHVIFYLAAIETNKDSVLLFEEPEVHSYPPYIKMLADRIVLNDENQYFISTHSPYMLNTLIDNLRDDELNVVLTYYEDYQTKIKILSAEELAEVQEWKTDIFFNIDRFINHLQEK